MPGVSRSLLGRVRMRRLELPRAASCDSFRSLYRALLRQASYLPDLNARNHARKHITARFRSYRPNRDVPLGSGGRPNTHVLRFDGHNESPSNPASRFDGQERQHSLWRQGCQMLHQLQRAGLGYQQDLLRVLLHTYGRKGKRRHELLAPLKEVMAQPDTADAVSEQLAKFQRFPIDVAEKLPRLDSKLEILLKSQRKTKIRMSTRPSVKNERLDIPMQNIWLRPTPVKRVANLVRRWYAERLDEALPPLPTAEWTVLEELARGRRKWDGPVSRRSPCGFTPTQAHTQRDPIGRSDAIASPLLDQALGLMRVNKTGGREQPHRLTNRYMRKLYGHMFQMCANMTWNVERESWTVKWGSTKPERSKASLDVPKLQVARQ